METQLQDLDFLIEYEAIDPLPRWAYSDIEWEEMSASMDKIVDGIMYKIKEPEPIDDFELFLSKI